MKKCVHATVVLSCLAAVDAWQSCPRAASPVQRSLRFANQGARTAKITTGSGVGGFGAPKAALRSRVVVASAAAPADSCDPFNPEFCDPIFIPAEQQPEFDLKRFVKLTTLFGAWYIANRKHYYNLRVCLVALVSKGIYSVVYSPG